MGKASRKKREAREARSDTADVRFKDKRCMHCGAKKSTTALWCDPCSAAGRRRAQFVGWPIHKPPLTDAQLENVKLLVKDRRWAWRALVEDDLSYYEGPTPVQDRVEGSV